jgi:cephalosporin-C deacetylase-like acetyl esterase
MKTFRNTGAIHTSSFLQRLFVLILTACVFSYKSYAQEEYDVVKNNWLEFTDVSNSLYHYLSSEAVELLKVRSRKISSISDHDQWVGRQNYIKQTLNELVGPFPEKTPLNAKVVRKIEKKGFRIEHIVFESLPGFFVTSSLYIPSGLKKKGKIPAVIYCSGHSDDGYRSPVYQHVIQNLVLKGFIVFAFDPVGQGERLEYFDEKSGISKVGGPTKEHSYPGAQAFITGSSQAFYMIWDGIRAIDYLVTRKEVDPSRIGITGRSGGGTQSAYIAAMDERIYAAAPENYLTNFTRLFQSIGPQDAEQNIFNLISSGLDHPDFLIVRAPKPALMITTTRDFFSIQGARETSGEVSEIYKSYGKKDFFSMIEDDAPHESTLKNRESMYAFFQKFLDNPGNSRDETTIPLTKEELMVTPTGQVSTSYMGETVYSLNHRFAELLENRLNILRKDPSAFLPGAVSSARRISGYKEPGPVAEPVFTGRIIKNGYSVEKYFIRGEGDYIVPYLLFIPEERSKKSMIYLHPEGKNAESKNGGEIEKLVRKGIIVLAPDLLGTGETGPGSFGGDANFDGASHNLWYASILIDHSITGIRAADVTRLSRVLLEKFPETELSGFAKSEMTPVILHAAAFSGLFRKIIIVAPVISYRSIVSSRYYNPHFIHNTVAGALKEYDLTDLAASIAPVRLLITGPVDPVGNSIGINELENDLEVVRKAYKLENAEDQLVVVPVKDTDFDINDAILSDNY